MSNPPLRPDTCTHCRRPTVRGTLQNGRDRSFDRQPQPAADVAPTDRYAYSRRARAVVCLDGEPHTPELVLRAHRCREYAQARYDARLRVDDIGEALAEALSSGWPNPSEAHP